MEEINIRNILNTYKLFSKRQREILENLYKKKETFTVKDLQKELLKDPEAKEILQKIRFVVNAEYEKAGVAKSKPKQNTSNSEDEIVLYI
jgi:hypothetical protein